MKPPEVWSQELENQEPGLRSPSFCATALSTSQPEFILLVSLSAPTPSFSHLSPGRYFFLSGHTVKMASAPTGAGLASLRCNPDSQVRERSWPSLTQTPPGANH